MERRATLTARVESLSEFLEIVQAMRAIAASHIQEAERSLSSIRQYTEHIERAIVEAAALVRWEDAAAAGEAEGAGDAAIVLAFCSEHGLSGAYSAKILNRAEQLLTSGTALGIIGRKGQLLAAERDSSIAWSLPMATHARSIAPLCVELLGRLAPYARVTIVFAEYGSGGAFTVRDKRIAPLDPPRIPVANRVSPPLHYLPAPLLLRDLTLEYLHAELMRAATEAFASENGARLAIMQTAQSNTEDKLAGLERQERELRQEEVTAELLDIVVGAEAARRHQSIGGLDQASPSSRLSAS